MTVISILGSGIMGTALSFPLADNGHEVRLVGTHLDRDIIESIQKTGVHPGLERKVPETVRAYQLEEAREAFEGAEVAMSGVNSFGVRWAGEQLASLLRPGMMVLSIAKGMEAAENGDLRILPEVLAERVPLQLRQRVSWSAVAGPSIAGEVAARRHDTCVVFTGRDEDALNKLASLFRTDYYHVWTSTDIIGVEGCAALKNCVALGVGFAQGILDRTGEPGSKDRTYNYAAALFGQGTVELGQMMRLLGGRPETPYGLAGVGDMYVTSQGGRNVIAGRYVGTGLRFSEVRKRMPGVTLEGAAAIVVIGDALPRLTERGIVKPEEFPLLRHLHAVVAKDEHLNMPWDTFFGGHANQ
jgi:glycerol-3-phosphate dehydrogenase (NAD(P)+)